MLRPQPAETPADALTGETAADIAAAVTITAISAEPGGR
jgi:hypothetical protein